MGWDGLRRVAELGLQLWGPTRRTRGFSRGGDSSTTCHEYYLTTLLYFKHHQCHCLDKDQAHIALKALPHVAKKDFIVYCSLFCIWFLA